MDGREEREGQEGRRERWVGGRSNRERWVERDEINRHEGGWDETDKAGSGRGSGTEEGQGQEAWMGLTVITIHDII